MTLLREYRSALHLAGMLACVGACGGNTGDPSGGGADGTGGTGLSATGGVVGSSVGTGGVTVGTGGTAVTGGTGGASTGGSGAAQTGGFAGSDIRPDPGSGACEDFTPCGGDPVGSWQFDTCYDPPPFIYRLFCPTVTETWRTSGSMRFDAGGLLSIVMTVEAEATLPASCVQQFGGCGSFTGCAAGTDGSCQCREPETDIAEGSYILDPDNHRMIMLDPEDGDLNTIYYCRQGDRMLAREQTDSGQIAVYEFIATP